MKLGEMNEQIAAFCDVRAKSVVAIQKETFRRLRETIEQGERVAIPGFGVFLTKERPAKEGEESTKSIRFKMQARTEQSENASRADRKAKKQANRSTEGTRAKDGETAAESADRKAKKLAKKLERDAAKPKEDNAVASTADVSPAKEPQ